MLTLDLELYMFAVMALAGAALGACSDVYKACRRALRWRGALAVLRDVAFAAAAGAVLAGGLLAASWGAFRLATWVGLAAGWGAYRSLAHPAVYPAAVSAFLRTRRWAHRGAARVQAAAARVRGALAKARAAAPAGTAGIVRRAVEAVRAAWGKRGGFRSA